MKIKVLFTALLLAISFALDANQMPKSDSVNKHDLDTVILSQIRQNTAKTAENTADGEYEEKSLDCAQKANDISTSALTIAIVTLLIAVVTLVFTMKTYKSQRKTQENTSPAFTKKRQLEVLLNLSYSLINKITNAYVVDYKLNNSKEGFIPSETLFSLTHIDSSELHLELFYNDNEDVAFDYIAFIKPSDYSLLRQLKNKIATYNKTCDIIVNQIQEQLVDIETIKQEYNYYLLKEGLFDLLKKVLEVINSVFSEQDRIEKLGGSDDVRVYLVRYVFFLMLVFQELYHPNDNDNILNLFSELNNNHDQIFKERLNSLNGLDEIVENTKDKWEEIFDDFDFSIAIDYIENFSFERFIDSIKLCLVKIHSHTDSNPLIKYKYQRMK